jgi:hypothetical protein
MMKERRRRDDQGIHIGRWVFVVLVFLLFALLWWIDRTEPAIIPVEEEVELEARTP